MVNNEAKAGDLGMLARLKQIEGMKKKKILTPRKLPETLMLHVGAPSLALSRIYEAHETQQIHSAPTRKGLKHC